MKLKCRKCNMEISLELKELKDSSLVCGEDGEDIIPRGYYLYSNGSHYSIYRDGKCIYDTKGKIIINKDDLINWKFHEDDSRLNGCCGCDGLDGINVVCKNGHEVGTLKTDCWMPHGFIAEPGLVEEMNTNAKYHPHG